MPKLVMSDPSGREQVYEIGPEPQVWGRGEDSDVILGSRSVARHHMRIWAEGERIMVEDLSGGQGLELDGEPVTGTFELKPGSDLGAGVFVFRVHGVRPDTAVEAEPLEEEEAPPPLLKGLRGPAQGVTIELQPGANDVGRDPNAYLVIEEASISRLHARLTVDDSGVQLIDLRSSNGTFVNGKRVDQARLQPGDRVRFGNVEFRFQLGEQVGAAGRRRKLLIIGAAAGVLLLLVIALALSGGSRKVQQQPPGPAQPRELPLELRVEQHLRTARAAMEKLEWKRALAEVDKALDLHPISAEANRLKKRIKGELQYKSFYEEGVALYDLNKWEEALAVFEKIPAESAYYAKIKYKIAEVRKKESERHLTEGRSYFRANQFRKAHHHFSKYLDLNPCDRKVYEKWLKKTEARMRHYEMRYTPYVYKCQGEKQPAVAEGKQDLDPLQLLKARYPRKKFFDIIKLYYLGKGKLAIDALRRIKVLDRSPAAVEKAKELERIMMVVVGKYNEGLSYLLQGDIKAAREQFEIAFSHDAKLMPPGVRSFYRESSSKKLGERLYKEGLGQFNREEYIKAFNLWQECLKINPNETSCQQGLMKLEGIAEQVVEMARQLERRGDRRAINAYKNAMRLCRPSAMAYKEAAAALARLQ